MLEGFCFYIYTHENGSKDQTGLCSDSLRYIWNYTYDCKSDGRRTNDGTVVWGNTRAADWQRWIWESEGGGTCVQRGRSNMAQNNQSEDVYIQQQLSPRRVKWGGQPSSSTSKHHESIMKIIRVTPPPPQQSFRSALILQQSRFLLLKASHVLHSHDCLWTGGLGPKRPSSHSGPHVVIRTNSAAHQVIASGPPPRFLWWISQSQNSGNQ